MTIKELLGKNWKEGMSVEDIDKALESFTMPEDMTSEVDKLRNQLSKANSEAKSYKDKLNEKLTDEEKAREERDKEIADIRAELEAYKQKDAVNENIKSLLSLGYDEALAENTAKAMVAGDLKTVFANQKTFIESVKAGVKSEVLKDTPTPSGGTANVPAVTKEQFDKMGFTEMMEFQHNNPELYNEYTKGD
jgi:chromosome segregation ATPase